MLLLWPKPETKSQVLDVLVRALFQDKAVLEMATPLGCTHDAVQRCTAALGAVTDFLLQLLLVIHGSIPWPSHSLRQSLSYVAVPRWLAKVKTKHSLAWAV